MRTLRGRVLVVATLGLAATIGLLTALTAVLAYQRSLQVLDEDLQRQLIHVLTEAADRPIETVLAEEPPASRVSTLLVLDSGDVTAVSRGPEDVATAAAAADLTAARTLEPTNLNGGDTTLRTVAQQIDDRRWVVVAGEYDAVRTQAWQFAALVATAGLGCLVAGAAGTAWALSRAVRPVHDLAADTGQISPDDLRPVRVPDGPQEVTDLAEEMNTLLQRVRDEDARRNRFLATLSHEMRTPLTVARSQLEALVLYGPDESRDAAAAAGQEVVRVSSMLDAFLTLARSEEPGFIAPSAQFLPSLAGDLRVRLAGLPAVTVDEPSAATVPLDRERIGQAVLNCVTNALRTADQVRISFDHSPQALAILIDDDGAGWPPDRERLLMPFESESGSSGLGLAVVAAVATAHGGQVELLDSPLGGARVRLTVPAY